MAVDHPADTPAVGAASVTDAPQPDAPAFPPTTLAAFLACCAGDWMALRSRFELGDGEPPAEEADSWFSSERGELQVSYLAAADPAEPGGLLIRPGGEAGSGRTLHFSADGAFQAETAVPFRGGWQLWPDGSLELICSGDGWERRERLWFTKPNLRLRSCLEQHADGRPARASFSSEIRRVSRPGS
ncbi:MAG: phycobiliprotein lyase [Synechococcaceae cyanobacterium]|nr:phycobiliprotein lyase [Synechococcaceae cyanobacterium]